MKMDTLREPCISIIIPVYNVEKYVKQCIQSIVEDPVCATGQVEVIIVDDGSPDASGAIADEFARKYDFVSVIHKQNAGVAAARNMGIQMAKGEWLYFADSDDYLAENAVSVLCEKCRQCQEADLLLFDAYQNTAKEEKGWEHFSRDHVWAERGEIASLQQGALYFPMVSSSIETTRVPLAAPWDKIYRRRFVLRCNLWFRENLHVLDDMIFNFEAFGEAAQVVYFKEKIYHYRYVESSITNSYKADRIDKDREVWKYIQKYIDASARTGRWTDSEKEGFQQAFYCRIIKSFAICCRLSFFHPANNRHMNEKIKYVKSVLKSAPYSEAFHLVEINHLEWKLRVIALMGRYCWGRGIYLLHLAENTIRRLKRTA